MSLYLWIADPRLREDMEVFLSKRRPTDSGVDLLCPYHFFANLPQDRIAREVRTGVVAAALTTDGKPAPILLVPRSSISNTPLRLSNQIGLLDMGYRGEVIARVDYHGDRHEYEIVQNSRLFQLVQHNWMPFENVHIVKSFEELPAAPDNRGSGGFGSTGK